MSTCATASVVLGTRAMAMDCFKLGEKVPLVITPVPTPGATDGSRQSMSKLTCRCVSWSTSASAACITARMPSSSMLRMS